MKLVWLFRPSFDCNDVSCLAIATITVVPHKHTYRTYAHAQRTHARKDGLTIGQRVNLHSYWKKGHYFADFLKKIHIKSTKNLQKKSAKNRPKNLQKICQKKSTKNPQINHNKSTKNLQRIYQKSTKNPQKNIRPTLS